METICTPRGMILDSLGRFEGEIGWRREPPVARERLGGVGDGTIGCCI
jgi:hypothetical protein